MKTIVLTLLIASSLFSFNAMDIKVEILSKIAHEIVKKDVVKVYIDKKDFYKKQVSLQNTKFVSSVDQADVVFISDEHKLKKYSYKNYILTTSYKLYKSNQNVLGVFFWQKGRPNIIIRKNVLEKMKLRLSGDFKKFLE